MDHLRHLCDSLAFDLALLAVGTPTTIGLLIWVTTSRGAL